MSTDDASAINKEILRRCIDDLWNDSRQDAFDALIHPSFLCHHVRNRDQDLHGTDAARAFIAGMRAAVPDLRLTTEQMFAEGDRVMVYVRGEGTHGGSLAGVPASGRPLTVTATAIVRIEGGRIAECWVIADELAVLQQLGAVAPLR